MTDAKPGSRAGVGANRHVDGEPYVEAVNQ